ncbi:MAG TPA: exodeoxyribonuclease V subunit alpha [Syntrophorhabdales bacterium]|nr:exodeoxyribonuclease V subunit alpha [Syntrophorhabdales bacterium]
MSREDSYQRTEHAGVLDLHFADWMVRLSAGVSADVLEDLRLAAVLASNAVGKGNVCVALADWAAEPIGSRDALGTHSTHYPNLAKWVKSLSTTPVVGRAGEFKPLILDRSYRLYLHRYWDYEGELASALRAKARSPKRSINDGLMEDSLRRLFPDKQGEELNWQRIAALAAMQNGLTIISGGPGTGKTFTMARILALMVEHAHGQRPAIALAAPTGKAAAKLRAVIQESKAGIDCSNDVKARIPEETSTLHRLLGARGRASFRFNKDNPLPYDVVVVDEASMVDLPLMANLASALKEDGRLILLGDKEQLASVEPGAVFGDICEAAGANTFSAAFRKQVRRFITHGLPANEQNITPLAGSAVMLARNYRFGGRSGIGVLSDLIKTGEGRAALELLKGATFKDISWREVPSAERLAHALEQSVLKYHSGYLRADEPAEAFALFSRFHMLCALREGPYGVTAINRTIQELAARRGLMRRQGRWYRGQPLMITANDYRLNLFNGDVGIILQDPETASLRVFFPTEKSAFKKVLPGRLTAYEAAHASTVHKSQGSEFDHVLLLLPDRHSEVVSRELVYTAVTRARDRVDIWGSEEAFIAAVARRTHRVSGLTDRLRENGE